MPLQMPDQTPTVPSQHVRVAWTLTLNDDQLSALVETSISNPLISLRVRPSGLADLPHTVRLLIEGEPNDALRVLNDLDKNLQKHHIG